MKKLDTNYISINKIANLAIFIFLLVKTLMFVLPSIGYNYLSEIDILNTHHVEPISYKVTLVLFLCFISINLEYFYNTDIIIRYKNRHDWYKQIIYNSYILAFLYSSSILIVSMIISFITNLNLIGLNELINILVNTFINMNIFAIFSLIYTLIRLFINKPIYSVIIEILTYLIINDIIFKITMYDFLGGMFFLTEIGMYSILKLVATGIIAIVISYIGTYRSVNKNFIEDKLEYE